jgi:hypothetical protein
VERRISMCDEPSLGDCLKMMWSKSSAPCWRKGCSFCAKFRADIPTSQRPTSSESCATALPWKSSIFVGFAMIRARTERSNYQHFPTNSLSCYRAIADYFPQDDHCGWVFILSVFSDWFDMGTITRGATRKNHSKNWHAKVLNFSSLVSQWDS